MHGMRSSRTIIALFALLAAAASVHASGCSVDCRDNLTCGAPPSATGMGGSGGAGGSGLSCVPEANDSPVDDACGVFVSAAGNDLAAGTKSAPLATFKKAIEMAGEAGGPISIYACAEEFNEAIELPAGTSVYGGLGCAIGWTYIGKMLKTTITASAGEVPVKLLGGAGTTRLADVRVEAASAQAAGGSSIAVIADNAAVELTRCDVVAGDAMDGAAGDPYAAPAQGGGDGKAGGNACSAVQVQGGAAVDNACANGLSTGGFGGIGAASTPLGGDNGAPLMAMNAGTAESMSGTCSPGGPGDPGADGEAGAGAAGLGTIDLTGYTGVSGNAGEPGHRAQGGGGGGGSSGGTGAGKCPMAGSAGGGAGGSGGAGGCGGAGGKAGGPGGSSIALISLGSTFTFSSVKLIAGKGGAGGAGGDGQAGGNGGNPGPGGTDGGFANLNPGCAGGAGGKGGAGGRGGGGAGGHSIGIAYSGQEPSTMGAMFTLGAAGMGGASAPEVTAGMGGQKVNTQAFLP
jgi:hypothetical protein